MGIFDEARREESLRAHLRSLLYDYAIEHLTVNYVQFTEQAVSDLLSQCLREIPMPDSFSIRLPEEPFDVLTRLFSLHNLEFYQENASNSAEAMQYLREFLATLKPAKGMKTRSQRAVENDDYECYTPEKRFEPMLSRRARRETPRPGSNDFRASLDKPYSTFLKSSKVDIRPVKVPLLEEPAVNFETTLNVTLSLTRETATEVKKLLQATAALSRPGPSYKNRYLDYTLRPDSPPLPHFSVESGPFMPIFPRKRMPGYGHVKPQETEKNLLLDTAKAVSGSPPSSMARLSAKLSSVKVEDNDELDLLTENMMVVDGWQTYHSSPERPSSSTSSSMTTPHSSQEYDQLELTISSPNTELTPIKLLKDSRMDLPAIPRSKRFGSDPKTTKPKRIGAKKSYAAFLLDTLNHSSTFTAPTSSPILDFDEPEAEPKVESEAHAEQGPSESENESNVGLGSMVGQPGSTVGTAIGLLPSAVIGNVGNANAVVDEFESELRDIFHNVQPEDPMAFVMKEKLNVENGKELLMDVPILASPNKHSSNDDVLFLTKKLGEHVAPGASATKAKPKVHQFLRKAKGIQSATLELSWVPFAVSDPLPTDEEVLGVQGDYVDDKNSSVLNDFDRMGISKEQGLARVRELVERVEGVSGGLETTVDERIWKEWSDRADQVTERILREQAEEDRFKIDIVLSREERRRLAGLGSGTGEKENGNEEESVSKENGDDFDVAVEVKDRAVLETSASPAPAHMEQRVPSDLALGPSWPSPTYPHDTDNAGEQEYMFPRAETDFGIPYHIPGGNDDASDDIGFGFYSSPTRAVPADYRYQSAGGYGYEDHQDEDSDKENQDPSLPLDSRVFPQAQEGNAEWDPSVFPSHDPTRQQRQFVSSYDGEDHYRPAKRLRMDWEEEDDEERVHDSGIGFNYTPSSPSRRASTTVYDQREYGTEHVRDEGAGYHRLFNEFDHSTLMSTQHQNSNFVPLSFDSQPVLDSQSQRLQPAPGPPPEVFSPPRISLSRAPPLNPISFYDHSAGIAKFAKLRAKKLRSPPPAPAPPQTSVASQVNLDNSVSKTAPETIFDKNTLRLPSPQDRVSPTSVHWYIASVNLLQKQALIRSLRSVACRVGLVERETLLDVDLIIDPHTAVIFTNLLSLPAQIEAFTKTVSVQSWRYDSLLIVFEAFAPSMAFKPDSATSAKETLSAYSPPVLKAIKKFRRDLSLADACNTKREGCHVKIAFAETVDEAAMFARSFGDAAEVNDVTSGLLWGDRVWLEVEDEFDEEEQSLAAAEGMNHFAACVILRQVSISELLDMEPEDRIARFEHQVGANRVVKLNEVIAYGKQDVQEDGASSMM